MDFEFSNLFASQFFLFYNFKSFIEYVSDERHQYDFYKYLGAIQVDDSGIKKVSTPDIMIKTMIKSNRSVIDVIKNTYVVFLFSKYECIMQEAIKCLICNNPEKLLIFLKKYPDYKRCVELDLGEFVRSNSKEEYIEKIADRFCFNIMNGKPSKVLGRIRYIMDYDYEAFTCLDELKIRRNGIVHDDELYSININEIEDYYKALESLLKVMAMALNDNNVNVIDEGNILGLK